MHQTSGGLPYQTLSAGPARFGALAVALPNGMVLLVGGVTPASTVAELYERDSDKFDPTGSLLQSASR